MAKFEDYAPGGAKDPTKQAGLDSEIKDAQDAQAGREDPTPEHDWQKRYEELEKLWSRQSQDLGYYRKMVDEHILNPTPVSQAAEENPEPITSDEFFDNPVDAVNKVVSTNPELKRITELENQIKQITASQAAKDFEEMHPDFQDVVQSPEFQNWVVERRSRQALATAANSYDYDAADTLLSLYKAEKGFSQVVNERQQEKAIENASLEGPTGSEPPATQHRYSRSEMFEVMLAAKQGDDKAQRYLTAHLPAYREALAKGNVRD